jgi:4a-hydroxytetrahydrobiopterin dehydratase
MPGTLPIIPDDEVVRRLREELPGWTLENGWIRRKYSTDGWPTTLMLVNAIAFVSEAAWHHPDLEVTWGKVWVKLKTHARGGITERDFALAKEIERLALWRPAAGSALEGTPNKWVAARRET